jgi:hypothetical protein
VRKARQASPQKKRPSASTADAPGFHAHIRELIEQRDTLMGQIDFMRSRTNAPLALLEKAAALLTRHWSRSTWHGREGLLHAARFMLGAQRWAGDDLRRARSP